MGILFVALEKQMQKQFVDILKSRDKSFAYIPEPKGQAKLAKARFVGVLRSHYKKRKTKRGRRRSFLEEIKRSKVKGVRIINHIRIFKFGE